MKVCEKKSPDFTVCRFIATLDIPQWMTIKKQWYYIGVWLYFHTPALLDSFQINTNCSNTVHRIHSHSAFVVRFSSFLLRFVSVDVHKEFLGRQVAQTIDLKNNIQLVHTYIRLNP